MPYTIGVDFGTESARSLLVDVRSGREVATAVHEYRSGVIDESLPIDGATDRLPPDWALQDPDDYLRAIKETVPAVIAEASVEPRDVIGIGIDFTACTMLPVLRDGAPLSRHQEFQRNPHAWVKLWKHHAAQPEADLINEVAATTGQSWLARYGGRTSSEWFFAKALQILDEAPGIYGAADRLIEAADWVIWQLTGVESRNACTAGYKALWSKVDGFPTSEFFAALHPRFANIVDEKMSRAIESPGSQAGGLSPAGAALTGLNAGTPVAVANVDAHVSVPASTVTSPGRMVAVMGTSTCHLVLDARERHVGGMCGVVEDGIVPGLYGYEAGQPAVGDMFAWFIDNSVPEEYHELARAHGITVHQLLESRAAELVAGESGLLVLDWWNGNRSVLVDADLTGALIGATVATRPEEIYRALLESTAFGTRLIIEALQKRGVAVDEIVACGGLPQKNALLMQIYADVTGLPISVAASTQAPALGSAMFAAVAAGSSAGGYDTIEQAAHRMARLSDVRYLPREEPRAAYTELYNEYVRLHDYFGRDDDSVMKVLRRIRKRTMMPNQAHLAAEEGLNATRPA